MLLLLVCTDDLSSGIICITIKDRIVLVTGSTQGIGLATAHRLYSLGSSVVLNPPTDKDTFILEQFEDKNRVRFFAADISDEVALLNLKDFIFFEFGKLDCLVANAGVLPTPAGIDDISDENISRTIYVNPRGTFKSLKIFGRLIQETSQTGSIVNITSVDGIIGEPYGVIYSATKAGIFLPRNHSLESLTSPL